VVKEAGMIEVRIIQAGSSSNEEDDIAFELPTVPNDCGAVSMYCGELRNTVGVRHELNHLKSVQSNRTTASMTVTIVLVTQGKYAASLVLN
jgi:hypothetical protein